MEELFSSFDAANGFENGETQKAWLNSKETKEFLKDVLTKLGVNYTIIEDPEKLAGLLYGKLAGEAQKFDNDKYSESHFMGPDEFEAYKADPMYSFERDSYINNKLKSCNVDGYMDPDHENHFIFKALSKVGKMAFNAVKNVVSKKKEEKKAEEGVQAANSNLAAVQSGVVIPAGIQAAQINNAGGGLDKYIEAMKKIALAKKQEKNGPVVASQAGQTNKILFLLIAIAGGVILAKVLKIA